MDEISFSDFAASGYNYIPVIRQLPLTYEIKDLLRTFDEGSVWQLSSHGRSYVYITLDYQSRITLLGNSVIAEQEHTIHTWPDTDIWTYLEDLHAGLTVPPIDSLFVDLPPLLGGMIGIMPRLASQQPNNAWPDALWLVVKTLIIADIDGRNLWLLAFGDPIHSHTYTKLNQTLDEISDRLAHIPPEDALMRKQQVTANQHFNQKKSKQAELQVAADKVAQEIEDSYLSMQFASIISCENTPKPDLAEFLAFQNARHISYWLKEPNFHLLGASDKIHIHVDERDIFLHLVSPIPNISQALASLLWDDLSNDISKLALSGSLRFNPSDIHDLKDYWSTPYLQAEMGKNTDAFDVLKACYPNSAYLGLPKNTIRKTLLMQSIAPQALGCQIAMIGWDKQMFSFVSQVAKHWQCLAEALNAHGISHEESGFPVIPGVKPLLPQDES